MKETIDPVNLKDLIPNEVAQGGFYRYNGSLTTPPCYETASWNVMKNPIYFSREEVKKEFLVLKEKVAKI